MSALAEVPGTEPEQIRFDERQSFQRAVLQRHGNKCSNCGSEDRLRVRMIVPEEAGGVLSVSNGAVLCRTCDMARDSIPDPSSKNRSFVVSIWMSRKLRDQVEGCIDPTKSFKSWSSMTRYLMSRYVLDEPRFDDLEQYQDNQSETKVTVRVDKATYNVFATRLKIRGSTVTEALRSLYMMYATGAGAVLQERIK